MWRCSEMQPEARGPERAGLLELHEDEALRGPRRVSNAPGPSAPGPQQRDYLRVWGVFSQASFGSRDAPGTPSRERLRFANAIYDKNMLDFWCECVPGLHGCWRCEPVACEFEGSLRANETQVPMLIFMLGFFGFMDYMCPSTSHEY